MKKYNSFSEWAKDYPQAFKESLTLIDKSSGRPLIETICKELDWLTPAELREMDLKLISRFPKRCFTEFEFKTKYSKFYKKAIFYNQEVNLFTHFKSITELGKEFLKYNLRFKTIFFVIKIGNSVVEWNLTAPYEERTFLSLCEDMFREESSFYGIAYLPDMETKMKYAFELNDELKGVTTIFEENINNVIDSYVSSFKYRYYILKNKKKVFSDY